MILEVRPQQRHVEPFADTPIPLNPKHIVEVLKACQPNACHTIPAFHFFLEQLLISTANVSPVLTSSSRGEQDTETETEWWIPIGADTPVTGPHSHVAEIHSSVAEPHLFAMFDFTFGRKGSMMCRTVART